MKISETKSILRTCHAYLPIFRTYETNLITHTHALLSSLTPHQLLISDTTLTRSELLPSIVSNDFLLSDDDKNTPVRNTLQLCFSVGKKSKQWLKNYATLLLFGVWYSNTRRNDRDFTRKERAEKIFK